MRLYLPLLLFLFTNLQFSFATEATFKSEVEVSETIITLGDIATFDEQSERVHALSSRRIGTTAPVGKVAHFQKHTILKQLAAQGLLPDDISWTGPETISVICTGTSVGHQKIEDIIKNFIIENQDILPNAEITFTPSELPLPFSLPPGDVSWQVFPSRSKILGSSRFSIIFRVDERVSRNISVKGRLTAFAPVVVATDNLKRDMALHDENYTMESRDISEIRDPILDPMEMIGKQVSRNIRNGKVIESYQLRKIPLVLRGERVEILVRSGALKLTATGISRSDGGLHDIIRIKNTSSNKIIQCHVIGRGSVELKL